MKDDYWESGTWKTTEISLEMLYEYTVYIFAFPLWFVNTFVLDLSWVADATYIVNTFILIENQPPY